MAPNFSSPSEEDEVSKQTWKRTGSCLQCGKCCNSVITTLKYCPELDDYLRWLSYHAGVTVHHHEEAGTVSVKFANKCRCLHFRSGKAECNYYHSNRPKICRDFPTNPDAGSFCKGYTFELIAKEEVAPEDIPQELQEPAEEPEKEFEQDGQYRPKWTREGTCNRCGKCCNTIVTTMMYNSGLRDYLEWLSLHQGIVVKRDKSTNVVWVEFRNKCSNLRFKRDKAVCRIYNDRPKVCRVFPLDPITGRHCTNYTFKLSDPALPP